MRVSAPDDIYDTADRADTVVVLDFETSGLSPGYGDRVIEIGAVLVRHGTIVRRFQSLVNPGIRINTFIEGYTGITNAMLRTAPPSDEVMAQFAAFLGSYNLVAHNASFDKRFLDHEFGRIGRAYTGQFACSLLVARRLLQDMPNHRLGTLVAAQGIPNDGTFHRALADSEMTARLWLKMLQGLDARFAIETPSFTLMQRLQRQPKHTVEKFLARGGFAVHAVSD